MYIGNLLGGIAQGRDPYWQEGVKGGVHGSHIRGLIKGALYMRGNFGIEIAQQLLIGISNRLKDLSNRLKDYLNRLKEIIKSLF